MGASEVHLIDHVGRYPGNHSTLIAQQYGVTKDAVLQMAQKLQKKGYISKKAGTGKPKTSIYSLQSREWLL